MTKLGPKNPSDFLKKANHSKGWVAKVWGLMPARTLHRRCQPARQNFNPYIIYLGGEMMAKKYFKKALSMGLALTLCLSLAAPAFAADESTAQDKLNDALDKVINDTVNDWSKNDENDANDLLNGALDAIQPGNTKDEATAGDVTNAAEENGDNVVTDVANADQAANDLKDSLENSVNNASHFEAVLDEDGNPVLGEDGNVVVREVKDEDDKTETGKLDDFVTGKAGQVTKSLSVNR